MQGLGPGLLRAQYGLRLEQERTRRNVIVAGDDGKLFYLRIAFRQDVAGVNGVLRRGEGAILHDDPLRRNAVFDQPLRHFSGFCSSLIIRRRPAAGADDERLRIFLRAGFDDLEAFDQFVAHASVGIELEAERNDAKRIAVRQSVRQHAVMDRQLRVHCFPQRHDALPTIRSVGVRSTQFFQQGLNMFVRLAAVVSVVDHHFLDDGPGLSVFFPLPAAGAKADDGKRQQQAGDPESINAFHGKSFSLLHTCFRKGFLTPLYTTIFALLPPLGSLVTTICLSMRFLRSAT